jgi:N-acetylglucosaminyldiphosphoundecaprenol N-acetyl-beta-D-mannosaminyltransferase
MTPSTELSEVPAVRLAGIDVHALGEAECCRHIADALDAGRGGHVVTVNVDLLRRACRDPQFRGIVARAELVVADGMPLVWASRLQRTPLPERVAGSNLITSLSAEAARRGRSVYLLGGDPGTAEAVAAVLRARHPEIAIAGTCCPPLGFERHEPALAELERTLTAAAPDIVFVALGSPKQEEVIVRLRPALPRAWWLGVGISFSFLAGKVRRAPRWVQAAGLEWLHRLVQEPRRLARRYLVDGLPFAARLLGGALVARWRRGAR